MPDDRCSSEGQFVDRGVFDAVADASVNDEVDPAFERNDVGVVHNAVDHRGGDGGLTEDLVPPRERQVGGQDDRGLLVSSGEALEE